MGFDIAIDSNLNPMVIDTNTGPAMRTKPESIYDVNYEATAEMLNAVSTFRIHKAKGHIGTQDLVMPKFHHWHLILNEADSRFYERTGENSKLLRDGQCHTKSPPVPLNGQS